MKDRMTRRAFLAVSAIGAASVLIPSVALADESENGVAPSFDTEAKANWMQDPSIEALYDEIKQRYPDLNDTQIWEVVFSSSDPENLSNGTVQIEPRSSAAGTAAAMIEEAVKHIGYASSGINKFNEWYGWTSYQPWCDAFVSYCAAHSGSASIIGKYAYCPSHVNFFKDRGQWAGRGAAINVGDIIFYDWNGDGVSDHVGIVEWCDGATVGTIEGNTGNYPGSVARVSRSVWDGSIMGYGQPAYAAAQDYIDVMLWNSNGGEGQAFKFIPTGESDAAGHVLYYVYNEATNTYLQPKEISNGSQIIAYRWHGMQHQKWWLEDFSYNLGSGILLHNAAIDYCLGVKGSDIGARFTIDAPGTPSYTQMYAVPLDAITSSNHGDAYTLMSGVTGKVIALSY